ncbi:SMI1/KNR4 family protein [Vibrio nigripulchritudo]|uniref:SMI1/KNR4 family protein n=1 Tax=Vibrio nigripulchritudo TaxID=28173 RepID=UPI00066AA1C2|nr:SMI1/KNR4 family protein [Vibrio nigripulchritudo]BDU41127.1 cell wall assembly protein [Vibrio nigripulchritudo]BDU46867.1 cell wall assembly protein [Vibrio nigripulchritudo]
MLRDAQVDSLHDVIKVYRCYHEPTPIPVGQPTSDQIRSLEAQLNVRFYPDYVTFFRSASDVVFGSLSPVTATLPNAHTHIVSVCRRAWQDGGVPQTPIPICHDNGEFYCVNADGEVVYWSHQTHDLTDEKWHCIAQWIQCVLIDEELDQHDC